MGTIQIDGSTPKLTIGNATAEDATILFDGNAQDFYIALDDSADDLLIGLGSTVGTTPIISMDENKKVAMSADVTVGDDLGLISDSAVLTFGADSEITVTHVADTGLNIKHTATADDKPIVLTLQTGETDMAANDVIGKIAFQAPDEGTGTDAILVSAAVQAKAEGDHSSSSNATSLEFMTGASEAATAKVRITSAGHLVPTADDTYDLGTSSLQWRDIYTGDLNLNNTRHRKNEVDGTSGSWTIQEGNNDLFILNRINGKKYKFNLTEVE